jgi:hypothetical protein
MFKKCKNYGHEVGFFKKLDIYLHYVQISIKNEHNINV